MAVQQIERKRIDFLFVINQKYPLQKLARLILKKGESAVVLSTHYLFKFEKELLQKTNGRIQIFYFAELIDEKEMDTCDNDASKEIRLKSVPLQFRIERFMDFSTRRKNEIVYAKLLNSFKFENICFVSQLGIHSKFWLQRGATELALLDYRFLLFVSAICRKVAFVLKNAVYLFSTEFFYIAQHSGRAFVFVKEPKRIQLTSELKKRSYKPIKYFRFMARKSFILQRALQSAFGNNYSIVSTIHSFSPDLTAIAPVYLVQDGYLPSNYNYTSLDAYEGCFFVPRDPFGKEWFQKHGKTIANLPFIRQTTITVPQEMPVHEIATVVLALGHGGDWSALINRSDTDILVEKFISVAALFPKLKFIIRPHPTMVHPSHEGPNSLYRIRKAICFAFLENLFVSDLSLNEDLQRGDIFVSEYSDVLLSALQIGKIGLFTNFTQRRSFMEAFTQFGFAIARSTEELVATIKTIKEHTKEMQENYRQCLIRLKEHYEKCMIQ
jgi:hypothetical protein